MKLRRGLVAVGSIVSMLVFAFNPLAYAAQSNSSHYQVNEVFMGSGGVLHSCGTAYCSKQSVGELTAGRMAGAAFQAYGGFNTDREPYIAFSVVGGSTDIGTLSTVGTATTTAAFAVKTYLASGYVVQLASDPPTNNGLPPHSMATPATPTASAVGTEQFGINLVQNLTSCTTPAPANFGNNPVQVPDNTFSFGTVNANYNTCGKYMYQKGDTIANSPKSSGETDYTISFIYNISPTTPDGLYTFNGTLVATSTY